MSGDGPRCPVCAKAMVPVVFGMPSSELFEAAERGEVALGGCIIEGHSAVWKCADGHGRWTEGRR